jgi:UDP-N-acetylmuramate dehydrogenase
MNWWKSLEGKVSLSEPLRNYTTFKIGGKAKFFIEPKDIKNLKLLLNLVKKYRIPFFVIGSGSNILVNDKGIAGIVLRLNSSYFKKISFHNNQLNVGSSVLLNKLVLFTQDHGLSGAEFLAGIPGTVGGALVMNAGVSGKVKSIGDLVEDVTVMDYDGNIKTLQKKEIEFGYRESGLSKYIILSTRLRLVRKSKKEIKRRIKKYLDYRRTTQDLSHPSAGCIFKNPAGYSAGRLIDLCGLKGKRIGDACISLKHANFIINLGHSKASNVLRLMDLVEKKVKDRFNITLRPEIKIWQ